MLYLSMADEPKDKRKIEKLYDEYNSLMLYIAFDILHNREDAEDAVYSSWEKIIRHLKKINEISCNKTRSLIVTIVRRTAIDLYRRKKRSQEIPIEEYEEHPVFIQKDAGIENADLMMWIDSLPAIYREALILYYVHDLEYKEIADILSVSINTVASRIKRGRDLLGEQVRS